MKKEILLQIRINDEGSIVAEFNKPVVEKLSYPKVKDFFSLLDNAYDEATGVINNREKEQLQKEKEQLQKEKRTRMDIFSPKGTRVRYTGKGGYETQRKKANEYLDVDAIYLVERTKVGGFHTDVYLQEFPDISFNSVMFIKP